MANQSLSVPVLKDRAKRLRVALGEQGQHIAHSAALEVVAKQHGFKDWNTASAMVSNMVDTCPLNVGDRVQGKYLGHPFHGSVRAVAILSKGKFIRTCIEFDEPVEVVNFDSFSATRKRVSGVINRSGQSPRKRSDGIPHLQIEL